MRAAAILLLSAVAATSASAENRGQLFVGVGIEDFQVHHSEAPGVLVEYAAGTFGLYSLPDAFRVRFAGMASTDGDVWVGAGLSFEFPMAEGSRFFGELSFVPGVFQRGNAKPGEEVVHFPQFRSQIAVGYRFEDDRTLTVTASHRSNARLDGNGSSMETLMLRYGIPF